MGINFKNLGSPSPDGGLIIPREIFNALPSKVSKLDYLRESQGVVLDRWFERRTERDLVIKMNTGGGKTLVGLLMLQSCLNENQGPALYVAPNVFLVEQVVAQATELGLRTTTNPDDPDYLRGEAIGIVNIYKLINSRSVFGGPASTRASGLPIGALVVDDAHACLATAAEQFSLSIGRSSDAYLALLNLFEDALRSQNPGKFSELQDSDVRSTPQIVPFWSWRHRLHDVINILDASSDDDEVGWKWPLLKSTIHLCRAAFSSTRVEIAPTCLPISEIVGYRDSRRRIFLTATLADDSILVTDFACNPESVGRVISPESASDQGDRLIFAPQELNPTLSEDSVKELAAELARNHNVVVLVPSDRRARFWQDVSTLSSDRDDVAEIVSKLRENHVGLVVLVNKYDGIDLPDSACRVLIIDGLPEIYGTLDQRDAAVIGTRHNLFDRQMQRIEQGMGRGVRGVNDYCVVLILGLSLSQRIASPQLSNQFSPLTKAQLELSRQVCKQLSRPSIAAMRELIDQVLSRDIDWISASRNAVAGVQYGVGNLATTLLGIRRAFDEATLGRMIQAENIIQEQLNAGADDGIAGILFEILASYVDISDPNRAQQILASGLSRNPRILRPSTGVVHARMSNHHVQARRSAEYINNLEALGENPALWIRSLCERLSFDPERTADFEDAIELVGDVVGFESKRPERENGNGPDNLWGLGNATFAVIECKSGVTSSVINRDAAAQLMHSMTWFRSEYGDEVVATPMLIHPSRDLANNASLEEGSRIVTPDRLELLKDHLIAFVTSVYASSVSSDPDEVGRRLSEYSLNGYQVVTAHSRSFHS